jgi:hypothetical protein
MITPTIGRVVLFHSGYAHQTQMYPALVCCVHSNRLINIGGFRENGEPFGYTSVRLLQDDETASEGAPYACWMPYQKAQAEKHAAPVEEAPVTAIADEL